MSFGSKSLPPPTNDEVRRWQRIKEQGTCAATGKRGFVEIHHLLTPGGLRLGHRYTVGLASEVHAIVKTREFKEQWPSQELLNRQDQMICWDSVEIPGRAQRARPSPTARPTKRIGSMTTAATRRGKTVGRNKRKSQCTASAKTYPRSARLASLAELTRIDQELGLDRDGARAAAVSSDAGDEA